MWSLNWWDSKFWKRWIWTHQMKTQHGSLALAHHWIVIVARLRLIYFWYSKCKCSYYYTDLFILYAGIKGFNKGFVFSLSHAKWYLWLTFLFHWVKYRILFHLEISVFHVDLCDNIQWQAFVEVNMSFYWPVK